MGKLQKLRHLNIETNFLRSVPEFIGDLKQLTYLNVEDNELKVIPPGLRRNNLEVIKDENVRFGVELTYKNFKLPNNGAMDAISYTNFNRGDQALRITNANRPPTYMSVNTFKRLSNAKTAQANEHIYKRNSNVGNINDVFYLNGNTNVFINPMTTKMVKRKDIDFVKFV